jgi:hypothetical protein
METSSQNHLRVPANRLPSLHQRVLHSFVPSAGLMSESARHAACSLYRLHFLSMSAMKVAKLSSNRCSGCDGELVGHVSSISCSQCSESKSMAQVVADFEQKSDPDMVQAIPVRRRREMCGGPSGSLCFSDIGKRCSTSTIPWSPAVSSASDGSFLKSVYGEKDARADVQEANPSPNDLQEPAAGFQSQTHHSDEIASSEDGRMDASSYYESPEQMRASKTRSAVDSGIPTSSAREEAFDGPCNRTLLVSDHQEGLLVSRRHWRRSRQPLPTIIIIMHTCRATVCSRLPWYHFNNLIWV